MMNREERIKRMSNYIHSTDMWGDKLIMLEHFNDEVNFLFDHFEAQLKEKDAEIEKLKQGQDLLIKAHEDYIQEINNRTCKNCKYLSHNKLCCKIEEDNSIDVCFTFGYDFCCNKWESNQCVKTE